MKKSVFLILLFYYSISWAQLGTYFITNYSPLDYNGSNQVWSIVQDNRGVMYFAADQILEYDGVHWRKIPISNNTTVRSLAIDTATNIIYVGGVNQFGYLLPDSTGQLTYISISDELDSIVQKFDDVWKTEVGTDGVYFSTNSALFRYSLKDKKNGKDPLTIWKDSQSFFLLYKVNNRIFTGLRGKGIVEVIGDSLVPIKYNPKRDNLFTWFMFPYGNDQFLLGNSRSGLSVYNSESTEDYFLFKEPFLSKSEIQETDDFLYHSQLYSGVSLGNDTYALGTITDGVVIINNKGKIIHRINKSVGLQNQTIHYLYQDRQGGLWVAMTYGISRVEINTPITHFNDLSGIQGSIYNAIRTNGELYVSSNLGLFKKNKNSFIPIEGLTGPSAIQCFGLTNIEVPYDNKQHLFVSATDGIYEVLDDKAKLIFSFQSYDMVQAKEGTILMADNNLIYKLSFGRDKWMVNDTLKFNSEVSNLFLENDTSLWFIKDGIPNKISFDKDFITYSKPKSFSFDDKASDIDFSIISMLNKQVVFVSDNGLYRVAGGKLYKDTLVFGGLLNDEKYISQIEEVNDNEVWLNLKRGLRYQIKILFKENDSYQLDSILFNRLPTYSEFVSDGDSVMWVLSSKALYRLDVNKVKYNFLDEQALNRLVTINSDSVIFKGTYCKLESKSRSSQINSRVIKKTVLSYENNNITFEFALASFNNEKKNEFSYCLKRGNEEDVWSNWTSETKKEYTNLYEGSYQFMVKARNIYKVESKLSVYRFVIAAPWYRTVFAYFLYFVFFVIVIWIILRVYTNKLKKEKIQLEKIVRERTQEIWEKKEEISQQAENLRTVNESLIYKNQEINQQNAEIETQRDNLQSLTEDLQQRAEEISLQNEVLAQQRDSLESFNHDVQDSIKYALRLQNAALPKPKDLENVVEEAFVLFKPKDIVSGDFYWFATVEDNTVITAADCTGHGVPGALMSILGVSLIKEIVVREYMTHPGVILRKLRKGVISALNQSSNSIEKDGMDMSLISINHKESIIQYAGAFNSLYLIRPKENLGEDYDFMQESGKNEDFVLYEIKADKMPVSIYVRMDRFTTREFEYKKGDILYLFSDGFPDQFGGPKGKKFKYKPFKKMLLSNALEPMAKQKSIIEETFLSWKGDLEQVDDIVIIGIKL